METHIDVAGAVIEIALSWSVVDWAERAGSGETIDLSSFRLGPNVWIILE
jgi:hypothetical protein